MQCRRAVSRSSCVAKNAYSLTSALRATFHTSIVHYDSLISLWELDRAGGGHAIPDNTSQAGKMSGFKTASALSEEARLSSQTSNHESETPQAQETLNPLGGDLDESIIRNSHPQPRSYPLSATQPTSDAWKEHIHFLITRAQLYPRMGNLSAPDLKKARKEFEYEGIAIRPAHSNMDRSLPFPWAMTSSDVANKQDLDPVRDVLEKEVERFVSYMKPSIAEQVGRRAVARSVQSIVREFGRGRIDCQVYGSESNGLASPISDIDIRVFNKQHRSDVRHVRADKRVSATISQVCERLKESPDFICVQQRDGRFPIISAQHRESGVDVHIVATDDKSFQQALTKRFLTTYQHLKPLYCVVRAAFSTRSLLESFNGGLGSYGTLIMLLFSIARLPSSLPSSSQNSSSIGAQLLHFLDFYSDFDPSRRGLTLMPRPKCFGRHFSARTSRLFPTYTAAARRRGDPWRAGQWSMSCARPTQPYLLALQDPADPDNVLGRRAHAIKHLLASIRAMRADLRTELDAVQDERAWWGAPSEASPRPARSVLEPLVGRYHELCAAPRQKLQEFGEKVMRLEEAHLIKWRMN